MDCLEFYRCKWKTETTIGLEPLTKDKVIDVLKSYGFEKSEVRPQRWSHGNDPHAMLFLDESGTYLQILSV